MERDLFDVTKESLEMSLAQVNKLSKILIMI